LFRGGRLLALRRELDEHPSPRWFDSFLSLIVELMFFLNY
jgi:hypothetical protein